jgi:hypothetical protein
MRCWPRSRVMRPSLERFEVNPTCIGVAVTHRVSYTCRAAMKHLARFAHPLAIEAEPVPPRAVPAELPTLAQVRILR